MSTETDSRTAVTMMAVSGGYPEVFEKGLNRVSSGFFNSEDSIIFQAGTKMHEQQVAKRMAGGCFVLLLFAENVAKSCFQIKIGFATN